MADDVNGVLLLYNRPPGPDAATIMDHVRAFERYSRFNVWNVNTACGFPKALTSLEFRIVVLHYSLFGGAPYPLNKHFLRYLDSTDAYKIAFLQDEYHFCRPRFAFLNSYDVDCVYTLVEPAYWDEVYRRYTKVPKLVYTIPGYAAENLVELAEQITVPDEDRRIDVGYRGRTLPPYMGRGAREKAEIGLKFEDHARGHDLELDIAVDEESRIYGDNWFDFLANCRAVLGVEAGVSVFDLDDSVRTEYERLVAEKPDATFEEISEHVLTPKEGNIFYRTISPRHFEAATLRVCQILFEGSYSGMLEPMVHYIPLRKDFSNFDEVVERFRDRELRRTLTENAYRDLIASGKYSYRRFAENFDAELLSEGFDPAVGGDLAEGVAAALEEDRSRREAAIRRTAAIRRPFPGRAVLRPFLKPPLDSYRRWKYRRWEKRLASDARV